MFGSTVALAFVSTLKKISLAPTIEPWFTIGSWCAAHSHADTIVRTGVDYTGVGTAGYSRMLDFRVVVVWAGATNKQNTLLATFNLSCNYG